jgi:subtilase family serine protease
MHGSYAGAMAPGTPISIYVRLKGAHDDEIDAVVAAVSTPGSTMYGRSLTPEQYGRYFGAAPKDYARAIAVLLHAGFVIDDLAANRTDISAHASAAQVAAFFGSPIDVRTLRGRSFYTLRYQPVYPVGLNAAAVSGLDNYVQFHPLGLHRRPHQKLNGYFSWAPQDLAAAYDLNPLYAAGLNGSGITMANATFGAATQSDLSAFQKLFKLPAAALVSTPIPTSSKLSPYGNGESTLDVDAATGVARNVTFHQVVAKTTDNSSFDAVYGYIVNNLGSTVHVVTTSWGTCEFDMRGTPSLKIDDGLLKQAVLEHQYWFSASGDNGTDDCEDGDPGPGVLSIDYPGASPYVMSVGGTNVTAKIVNSNVTGWSAESTWQYSNSNGASGGGKSILYPKPSYQTKLTPNDGKRDVPDVSLLADDVNDGMWIVNGGLQGGWGGTSEAAPQWAGLFAIIEQRYHNGVKTDPHVRLYQLAAEPAKYRTVFHDITTGNNSVPKGVGDRHAPFAGFNAGRGFDLATGLGSYIGDALVKAY